MGKSIKKIITDALSNYNLIAVKKEVLSSDKFCYNHRHFGPGEIYTNIK